MKISSFSEFELPRSWVAFTRPASVKRLEPVLEKERREAAV